MFPAFLFGGFMTRSEMREQAFILLFESEFSTGQTVEELELTFEENIGELSQYAKELFEGAEAKFSELDAVIEGLSTGWKLARIAKVNLAILRLAIYEIDFVDSVPEGVSINEAVELAKKYSGEEDYAFINGVLGSYVRGK